MGHLWSMGVLLCFVLAFPPLLCLWRLLPARLVAAGIMLGCLALRAHYLSLTASAFIVVGYNDFPQVTSWG